MGEHKARGFASRCLVSQAGPGDSIASGGIVQVRLDIATYDGLNELARIAPNGIYPRRAGYYLILGAIQFLATINPTHVEVYIQDTLGFLRAFDWRDYPAVTDSFAKAHNVLYIEPDLGIELWTQQISGGPETIAVGDAATFLAVHRIS